MDENIKRLHDIERAICEFMSFWILTTEISGLRDFERRQTLKELLDRWNNIADMVELHENKQEYQERQR